MKKRNPVDFMDSVEAVDLLREALKLFRAKREAHPAYMDRIREQIRRHQKALRNIIGVEAL